ncbi:hypothetical protein D3Y55_21935 [Mesorhizobium sp. DCY119]|nr:hypothetical protein D3Y55_21935 [Mesorhizobium sp. DCY119]
MAKRCGLIPERVQHIWTAAEQSKLRRLAVTGVTRKEIAAELGLSVQQVAGRMMYSKIHLAKRPPKLVGDPIVDAIRLRAFDMKMSIADLDRSLGRTKTFQTCTHGKPISPAHIYRAVRALGGRMVVEWIDE